MKAQKSLLFLNDSSPAVLIYTWYVERKREIKYMKLHVFDLAFPVNVSYIYSYMSEAEEVQGDVL